MLLFYYITHTDQVTLWLLLSCKMSCIIASYNFVIFFLVNSVISRTFLVHFKIKGACPWSLHCTFKTGANNIPVLFNYMQFQFREHMMKCRKPAVFLLWNWSFCRFNTSDLERKKTLRSTYFLLFLCALMVFLCATDMYWLVMKFCPDCPGGYSVYFTRNSCCDLITLNLTAYFVENMYLLSNSFSACGHMLFFSKTHFVIPSLHFALLRYYSFSTPVLFYFLTVQNEHVQP